MDKAQAYALRLAGLDPRDYEAATERGSRQTWGQIVRIALPIAPAAWGLVVKSEPVSILRVSRSQDRDAEPFDITLSSPNRIAPIIAVPPVPVHPLEELVAIIKWGQQQADSSGSRTDGTSYECEVDWNCGQVVTVAGSEIEVQARRDNWGAAPPAAIGGYINPGISDVQAIVSPRGRRGEQPQRTLWHPSDLPAGPFPFNINVQPPPAFAYGLNLYSPAGVAGTIFQVAALALDVVTVIASMTVVSGTVSPFFRMPSGTRFIAIANIGMNASPFSVVYKLAL